MSSRVSTTVDLIVTHILSHVYPTHCFLSTTTPYPNVTIVTPLLLQMYASVYLLLIIQPSSKSLFVLHLPAMFNLVRIDIHHHIYVIHYIMCLLSLPSLVCPTYPLRLRPPPPYLLSPRSLLSKYHCLLCIYHILTNYCVCVLLLRGRDAVIHIRNNSPPPHSSNQYTIAASVTNCNDLNPNTDGKVRTTSSQTTLLHRKWIFGGLMLFSLSCIYTNLAYLLLP